MKSSLFARSISMSLAVVLTLAMLGGIDRLAQHEEAAPLWAQQTAARA